MTPPDNVGVTVTLREIYEKVNATDDKLDELTLAVSNMVALNKRLDQHHDRLNDHGSRIGVLETSNAVAAAQTRRPAPWYAVVGGVAAVIPGLAGIFGLIAVLGQIASALNQ